MKKRNKPTYKGLELDSKEEIEFYMWCEEAIEYNIIYKFDYQPDPFILSEKATIPVEKKLKTKTKIVEKHLFHPHVYTTDFIVYVNEEYKKLFNNVLIGKDDTIFHIDVKGSFQNYDGKRSFSINRKWVWDKYKVYINEVTLHKFFKLTWVPKGAIFTPRTNKKRKIYQECKKIQEIS